jgi:transposase
MLKSGRGWWDCAHLFATREAAEEYLYGWEREQQHKRAEREPELRHLRMAMADAHPDRGGPTRSSSPPAKSTNVP